MKYMACLVLSIILPFSLGCEESQGDKSQTPKPSTLTINGAGATFPYPVYSKWAYDYEAETGVKVNYQSIGSGGGISQVKNKTVDFGASDAPLELKELDEAGLLQFPLVIGGIVPVVHIEGLSKDGKGGALKLPPVVLANIFQGTIKNWDHPEIKAANPGLALPSQDINVVHRADGSGTTWIFTNYLAKVSASWKEKIGAGKSVEWPTGIGGKGNEGVAAYVSKLPGSIGYIEYAFALQNKMPYALLANQAGKYVEPTIGSFQAAAAHADWKNAPGYYMVLVDQPGDDTWPITGASFILMHRAAADPARAAELRKFFAWCYRHPAAAEALAYVPIPAEVYSGVEASWDKK